MLPIEINIGGLNWIDQEMLCFQNNIILLRSILEPHSKIKHSKVWGDDNDLRKMERYIRCTSAVNWKIDLSCLNLEGIHLEGADLRGGDLMYADLRGAHLECANLVEVNAQGAILDDAHLEGAHTQNMAFYRTSTKGTHWEW